MSRRNISLAWATPLVLAGALLAGCGGRSTTSAPTPSPDSPTTTGSDTTTSPSPSPSTDPAGPTASVQHASLSLPADWSIDTVASDQTAFSDDTRHALDAGLTENAGWPADEEPDKRTVAAAARSALDDPTYSSWRRLPDVMVNGTRLYHLQGKEDGIWHDEYGTMHLGYLITADFDGDLFYAKRPWQQAQIDKIMATFQLR